MKGLTEKYSGSSSEIGYTAVSGISGGAVNAALLSSFAVGEEVEAAERMYTFWQNASNAKLQQDWFGGVLTGLTMEEGLYDESPMKSFL